MNEQSYKTVGRPGEFELVEKKSRFIGRCANVATEPDAAAFIDEIKKRHRDATHNVSAYLLREGGLSRCSDDGEPAGTAGMPVLDAVAKPGLCDVAVVVTRYFGGTLLGTGGLVRAYGRAASGAIEAAGVVSVSLCERYGLNVDYALFEQAKRLVESAGGKLLASDFGADVRIEALFLPGAARAFLAGVGELTNGKVAPELLERRYEIF